MFKLNDSNIFIGQIKQLLKDFNLPKCSIYNTNKRMCDNKNYIKNNDIVKYNKSSNSINIVDKYYFNKKILNLTENFEIVNNIYDRETHRYLGKYLRFIRDYSNVNLMSMYNCFDYSEIDTNVIKSIKLNNTTIVDLSDNNYVYYECPIKYYNTYTIGVNCNQSIEIFVNYYHENSFYDFNLNLYKNTLVKISKCSFNNPYIYKNILKYKPTENDMLNEDNLVMIIKIPKTNKSSIVVLEGNYLKNTKKDYSTQKLIDGTLFKYKLESEDEIRYAGSLNFNTELELLSFKNNLNHNLLATRMIEYLSENTITSISADYDIAKIQRELTLLGYLKEYNKGIWTDDIRKAIYKYIKDNNLNNEKYDMLSYIDKDVEKALGYLDYTSVTKVNDEWEKID